MLFVKIGEVVVMTTLVCVCIDHSVIISIILQDTRNCLGRNG